MLLLSMHIPLVRSSDDLDRSKRGRGDPYFIFRVNTYFFSLDIDWKQ